MQTLRAAADLLAAANSIDTLSPLATAVACGGAPAPLDAHTRRSLGLDDDVIDARIAAGHGALRALLLVVSARITLRDFLPRLAGRLSTRTPHVLWIVIATQPDTGEIALAAWSDDRRPPRIAALLANRAALVDSDAETLRALGAGGANRDILTHARWVEILGREALTVRFYRALERGVETMAESSRVGSSEARHEIALLNTSRLLFLSFLEAKGWLDGDSAFLAHRFDASMLAGGRFHDRVLRPLFFGTLNTPLRRRSAAAHRFGSIPFLNGGLFTRTVSERRHRGLSFSDEAYGELIAGVFGQYRFTAREESANWTEAAVDPEMLGRAFESLMAAPERRRTGAFFTPFTLVEHVVDAGLEAALALDVDSVKALTVLDPACGSGAFLVHVLERISARLIRFGDTRDVGVVRREVLTRSIFGVDVNPTAVWLCELRLWLSVVIESSETNPNAVVPLPNLDRNVRTGDALSGRGFGDADTRLSGGAALRRLRQRYANASGPRKESLARTLDRAERARALLATDEELLTIAHHRRDLVVTRRGRDLFGEPYRPSRDELLSADVLRGRAAALRALRRRISSGGALPFSFPVHFADVASRGGFGLIVGNPPWVRMHHVAPQQRADFRRDYAVARNASWEGGAGPSGAGRGFAAQVDLAALFVERSVRLLGPNAALALLVPVKLWQSLAGGGVRRLLAQTTQLACVEDHSEAPSTFDAAVYPSLVVAKRNADASTPSACVRMAVHHTGHAPFVWQAPADSLALDASPGAPWLLLPPDARHAFDKLRAAGRPLAQTPFGRPHLGVKCGCNEAFIVELLGVHGELADVLTSDDKRISIEREMLRPLLRGEQLRRWCVPDRLEYIIWTHDASDAPRSSLPPHAARWLAKWKRRLDARTDSRHRARWWSLFRTESARSDRPRVVWGDLGKEPRASVLHAGDTTAPINSCYVARCPTLADAHALAALLNGPLARAWLNSVAEPARGGYRRYLGWTLSLLPMPTDWQRARDILAPLGQRGQRGLAPNDNELFAASLDAYGVTHDAVAPLVAWQCR